MPDTSAGQLIFPHSAMRRGIAEHMVRSKLQTAPHVTTVFEVDMQAVSAHRAIHKAAFANQGVNLTLTAYLVAAVVSALQAHPRLNSEWTDEGVLVKLSQHIGIAVALDDGLIVPVISQCAGLQPVRFGTLYL